MELKANCDTCIHADVCFRRPTFEQLFAEEEVIEPLKRVNEMTDWIVVDVRCRDHRIDIGRVGKEDTDYGIVNKPEKKKKLFGFVPKEFKYD